MTKKVLDKILKTFIIVLNTIWGLWMSIYCIAVLCESWYAIEGTVSAVALSAAVLVFLNGINIVVRQYIKNY